MREDLGNDFCPYTGEEFWAQYRKFLKTKKWNFVGSEELAYSNHLNAIIQEGLKLPANCIIRCPAVIGGKKTKLGEFCNIRHLSLLYNVEAGEDCLFHGADVRNSKLGKRCLVFSRFTRNSILENDVQVGFGHNFDSCIVREGAWILTPQVTYGSGEYYSGLEITGWDNKKEKLIARKLSAKEIRDLRRQLPQAQGRTMPRNTLGLRRRFAAEKELALHEPLKIL